MTKILGVFVAGMMMLGLASGVNAYWWTPSSDIKIENDHTSVTTVAKADVNTGSVNQVGGMVTTAKTGDIYGVSAVGLSQVNMTKFGGCACSHVGDVKVENDQTHVTTIAKANADTGKVSQFSWGGMKMGTTGAVTYVSTDATSVVNYTDFSVSAVN